MEKFNFIELRKQAKELILNNDFETVYKNYDLEIVLPESMFDTTKYEDPKYWDTDYFIFQAILNDFNFAQLMNSFNKSFPNLNFSEFLLYIRGLIDDKIIDIGFNGKMQFIKIPPNEWLERDFLHFYSIVSKSDQEIYQKKIIKSSKCLSYQLLYGVCKTKNMRLFMELKDEIKYFEFIKNHMDIILLICLNNCFEEMVEYLYKNHKKYFESVFSEHPIISTELISSLNKLNQNMKNQMIDKIQNFKNKVLCLSILEKIK